MKVKGVMEKKAVPDSKTEKGLWISRLGISKSNEQRGFVRTVRQVVLFHAGGCKLEKSEEYFNAQVLCKSLRWIGWRSEAGILRGEKLIRPLVEDARTSAR